MEIEVIKENGEKLLESFDCDREEINQYLYDNIKDGADAVTYCLYETIKGEKSVVALASLACGSILVEDRNHYYFYPAVEIKAFAVDKKYQHKSFGEYGKWSELAIDTVISIISEFTTNQCGANHIILYSVKEAVGFYEKTGFQHFSELMVKNSDRFVAGCEGMYMQLA